MKAGSPPSHTHSHTRTKWCRSGVGLNSLRFRAHSPSPAHTALCDITADHNAPLDPPIGSCDLFFSASQDLYNHIFCKPISQTKKNKKDLKYFLKTLERSRGRRTWKRTKKGRKEKVTINDVSREESASLENRPQCTSIFKLSFFGEFHIVFKVLLSSCLSFAK